jgi:hypothetical protein
LLKYCVVTSAGARAGRSLVLIAASPDDERLRAARKPLLVQAGLEETAADWQ